MAESVSDRPVFVVGMARSGTTLIGTMIGAHPDLTIAPETHFLDLCLDRFGDAEIVSDDDLIEYWRAYAAEERFRVLGLDADAIERHLITEGVRRFADVYRVLMQFYAKHVGGRGWGDKSHLDHRYLDWLLEVYPDARIVCVIRDPRATVASLLNAPWSSGKAFYYALQWRETMRIVERFEAHARVLVVQYERAVQEPDETLARICSFLEVDRSPEMIDRPNDPAPVSTDKDWSLGEWWQQHKEKALGPISTESLDRWREDLSPYEIAVVEHLCAEGMREWHYRPTTDGLTIGQGLRLGMQRLLRILRAGLRPIRTAKTLQRAPTIFSPKP